MTIQAPDEATETKAEPVALQKDELAQLTREIIRAELRHTLREVIRAELTRFLRKIMVIGARLLRKIIRFELRAERDRKSFASASELMKIDEVSAYLGTNRRSIYDCRKARDRAKTDEARKAAFPPEYPIMGTPRFKRSEIDAWVTSHKK